MRSNYGHSLAGIPFPDTGCAQLHRSRCCLRNQENAAQRTKKNCLPPVSPLRAPGCQWMKAGQSQGKNARKRLISIRFLDLPGCPCDLPERLQEFLGIPNSEWRCRIALCSKRQCWHHPRLRKVQSSRTTRTQVASGTRSVPSGTLSVPPTMGRPETDSVFLPGAYCCTVGDGCRLTPRRWPARPS